MICPKCGLRQTTEATKCTNCGVTFSKIAISLRESSYARMATLWWQEPRNISKRIEPKDILKLAAFILVASAFSYIWVYKLSIDPFLSIIVSIGIGGLAILVLKTLDSSSPKNIYLTPTEIVRARGAEHEILRCENIKACRFVQGQDQSDNHLDITTRDERRRFIGVPHGLDATDVISALSFCHVKCELSKR